METKNCQSCAAKDYSTLHEAGVYECWECHTVFWLVGANEPQEVIDAAYDRMTAFLEDYPDWKQVG